MDDKRMVVEVYGGGYVEMAMGYIMRLLTQWGVK